MTITLRPYQAETLDKARAALGRTRRVLLQLPTGGGKTAIASAVAHSVASRGKVMWFVCHRRELVEQTSYTFTKAGIPHSFVAAGKATDTKARIFICSVDTLKNRVKLLQAPDVVVWDECHHLAAAGWMAVMNGLPPATRHLGLSATPERADGQGLSLAFDEMVIGPSPADLIASGYLSRYQAFAPSVPDLSGVHKRGGDYKRDELGEAMDKPKLTGDMIAHWMKLANGLRTVGFACSIAHSEHLAAQFNAAGIPAGHLDGGTHRDERKRVIEAFANDEIRVLFNVDLFGEGFDLSAIAQRDVTIDAGIGARPTLSLSLHLQQMGRILRPTPGKLAIWLDHAGNTHKHGFPDDEREWSLDGREAGGPGEKIIRPPMTCSGCFAQIRLPLPPNCPHCNKVLKAPGPDIPREEHPEVSDDDLVLMDAQQRKAIKMRRAMEEKACTDLAELVALGQRRGYASPQGWAFKAWQRRKTGANSHAG